MNCWILASVLLYHITIKLLRLEIKKRYGKLQKKNAILHAKVKTQQSFQVDRTNPKIQEHMEQYISTFERDETVNYD
jgi:uncharacterized protein YpmS